MKLVPTDIASQLRELVIGTQGMFSEASSLRQLSERAGKCGGADAEHRRLPYLHADLDKPETILARISGVDSVVNVVPTSE